MKELENERLIYPFPIFAIYSIYPLLLMANTNQNTIYPVWEILIYLFGVSGSEDDVIAGAVLAAVIVVIGLLMGSIAPFGFIAIK